MDRPFVTTLFDPGAEAFFAGKDPSGGPVWRVHGGVPGDRAILIPREHDPGWADIQEILEPGPGRRNPACPLVGTCGGCPWMHIGQTGQMEIRRARLARLFRAQGIRLEEEQIRSFPSPAELGYRYRARFQCDLAGSGGRIGFHRAGARDLLDVPTCPVLAPPLHAAYHAARKLLLKILPPDLTGFELTVLPRAPGALLYLNPRDLAPVSWPGLGESLLAETGGELAGVAVRLEKNGPRPEILGPSFITGQTPGGQPVAAPARGFIQANLGAADVLTRQVVRLSGAAPGMRIAEVFAGSGLLSWAMAAAGAQVRGIERDGMAVAAGQQLPTPPTGSLSLEQADASTWPGGDQLATEDVWVADPPRSGLGRLAQRWAKQGPPVIVLVSCHSPALAQDAAVFSEMGFSISEVIQIDLFPQTPFTETIVRLESPFIKRG